MSQVTKPPRPKFAAKIALIQDVKLFEKLLNHFSADAVATAPWTVEGADQFLNKAASHTSSVDNCTATVMTGRKTGKISHLDPEQRVNQTAIKRFKLKQEQESHKDPSEINIGNFISEALDPDTANAVLVGGKANCNSEIRSGQRRNANAAKLSDKLLTALKANGLDPSYFLQQDGMVDLAYISKNAAGEKHPLSDTVLINIHSHLGEKKLNFPKTKHELAIFLNEYFGKWHVSKQDKLSWLNKNLDIDNPNFIEEIPRHLFDKHA